ncbi:MAG: hypothetical protein KDA17_07275, partial [Candidatus Saccharibacteria bacterium]|nr:hypothetical protein [Candidatus Saccharibacteria bacterium]
SHTITQEEMREIAHLAGIGFGQGDSPAMFDDTLSHISDSDTIMLARHEGQLAGFSMAKRYLWRISY